MRALSVVGVVGVLVFGQLAGGAQSPAGASGGLAAGLQPPPTPAALTPPDGNVRFVTAHAVGTQDYICVGSADGSTSSWLFFGPQATLSIPLGSVNLQVFTHFLSPVPGANLAPLPACTLSFATGTLDCPTWQSSWDSSAVWGEKVGSVPAGSDLSCPNAGAIPCLLLKAVQTRRGQFGPGYLSRTTYVQRLNTRGGAAPVTSCKAGDQALVPYSADYTFFQPR